MRLLPKHHCTGADLETELAERLQPLLFRAADGLSCPGSCFTLHVYSAAPFGESTSANLLVGRALGNVPLEQPAAPGPSSLALELIPLAGRAPAHPAELVRARNALGRILADPDLGDADKADAAAALARLNLPRIAPRRMASLKFLLGVTASGSREVRLASLDDSGFGTVAAVPLDALCCLRVRRGRDLALEIGERLRHERLVAGDPGPVRSELGDWTIDFEARPRPQGTCDVGVRVRAAPELGFPCAEFAVVAWPETGGVEWHIAELEADGTALLAGLPAGRHRLGIGLAPRALAASGYQPALGGGRTSGQGGGEAPDRLQIADPALGNSRCVWLWEERAGSATFVAESVFRGAERRGIWRAEAEATTLGPAVRRHGAGPPRAVRVRAAVRTRGAAKPASSSTPGRLICLVLL
jgi:hypothetical protein